MYYQHDPMVEMHSVTFLSCSDSVTCQSIKIVFPDCLVIYSLHFGSFWAQFQYSAGLAIIIHSHNITAFICTILKFNLVNHSIPLLISIDCLACSCFLIMFLAVIRNDISVFVRLTQFICRGLSKNENFSFELQDPDNDHTLTKGLFDTTQSSDILCWSWFNELLLCVRWASVIFSHGFSEFPFPNTHFEMHSPVSPLSIHTLKHILHSPSVNFYTHPS